jgi:sulfur carrier protein ThiS
VGEIVVRVKLYGILGMRVPGYDVTQGMSVTLKKGSTFADLLRALHLSENDASVLLVKGLPRRLTDIVDEPGEVAIFTAISGG